MYITCKTRKETIPSMQRIECYTMFAPVEEGIGMHARCKRMYDTMAYNERRLLVYAREGTKDCHVSYWLSWSSSFSRGFSCTAKHVIPSVMTKTIMATTQNPFI